MVVVEEVPNAVACELCVVVVSSSLFCLCLSLDGGEELVVVDVSVGVDDAVVVEVGGSVLVPVVVRWCVGGEEGDG